MLGFDDHLRPIFSGVPDRHSSLATPLLICILVNILLPYPNHCMKMELPIVLQWPSSSFPHLVGCLVLSESHRLVLIAQVSLSKAPVVHQVIGKTGRIPPLGHHVPHCFVKVLPGVLEERVTEKHSAGCNGQRGRVWRWSKHFLGWLLLYGLVYLQWQFVNK